MARSLFNKDGARKYLTARERLAFARAAHARGGLVGTFCLTLVFTGARISEVLELTRNRVDVSNCVIVFETLKRRQRGVFRPIPIPLRLAELLGEVHKLNDQDLYNDDRMWSWGRTTGWKHVKSVMREARIAPPQAMPKAARHAFGIDAVQSSVSLNIVQRWLGHARIETIAIYTDALGDEERKLAQRTWQFIQSALYD